MFADHITTALSTARGRALDDVSRVIWKGLAEGLLSDNEAQAFAEQLHARRMAEGAVRASQAITGGQGRPRSIFPTRKPQRPPLRPVAMERRRRLASSGPLPPSIACRFTTGELAVLRIVGDECRDRGACTKPIDAIAARAGVGRTTTQNALRLASRPATRHAPPARRQSIIRTPTVTANIPCFCPPRVCGVIIHAQQRNLPGF